MIAREFIAIILMVKLIKMQCKAWDLPLKILKKIMQYRLQFRLSVQFKDTFIVKYPITQYDVGKWAFFFFFLILQCGSGYKKVIFEKYKQDWDLLVHTKAPVTEKACLQITGVSLDCTKLRVPFPHFNKLILFWSPLLLWFEKKA